MAYKKSIRIFILLSIAIGVVLGWQTTSAAQTYSEEATLTDGVEGIDVNRSTTINARVWAIHNVGDHMLVGGAFLNVRDRSSFDTIPRPYLAAFDPHSGEYSPDFLAQPNGTVYDIVDLDGQALLIGEFSSVNSVPNTHGLALVDPNTGLVDTSLEIDLNNSGLIRSAARHDNFLYLGGSFNSIEVGGVRAPLSGLARINLATMTLDPSFAPTVEGAGSVWGVDVDSTGRIFAGGYFSTINNTPNTETLVALNPDGSLVPGWGHGFPGPRCVAAWSINCGAVNDLAVYEDKVFVAGAKHFWTAKSTATGEVLAVKEISNDGQTVEVLNGMIVVGCHCSHGNSDEFPGVIDRYLRVIDPDLLTEVESPTVNSKGGAGGWASAVDPRGCLWGGGELSSSFVNGVQEPAWNLLRFCPQGVGSAQSVRTAAVSADQTPPSAPTNLAVSAFGSSVELSWNSNESQVGFAILRDGIVVARTSGTTYRDLLVDPGVHSWQVVAYDMAGNVSPASGVSTPIEIAQPVNVAVNATATSSGVDNDNVAANAIDGSTDPLFANGSVARTDGGSSWFNLDLGQRYYVDYIEMYPSENFTELNNRARIYPSLSPITAADRVEAAEQGLSVWTGPRAPEEARIERADLATEARYIRLLRTSRISLAEIRVFATPVSPTPAAPPADTEAPSAPVWKAVRTQDNATILRWGGASDNRGVVYYEVYDAASRELLGRTIEPTLLVDGSDRRTSEFIIVSYDAAGLDSGNSPVVPDDVVLAACSAVRDGTNVEVTWDMNVDPEKFIVRRTVDGGNTFWRGAPAGNLRSFTDTDRSGALEYLVEARNGNTVVASVGCEVTEDIPDPVDPVEEPVGELFTTCSAVRDGTNVTVTWDANSDPDRFVVRRTVDGDRTFWRGAPAGNLRTFTDTDRDGTLDYLVEARNGNTVIASINCDGAVDEVDLAPEGLRSTFADRSRIVLNWQSTGDFEIEVNGEIVAEHDGRWFTLRDLTPDTSYTVRIRFVGSNSWSEPLQVSTNP